MKTLAIILALTNFAAAQDHYGPAATAPSCTEKFKGLPEVARKLHVQPSKATGDIVLSMCDGRNYSLIELMNAFIDRMDKNLK